MTTQPLQNLGSAPNPAGESQPSPAGPRTKHCPTCQQDKPVREFYTRYKPGVSGRSATETFPHCKNCRRERKKAERARKRKEMHTAVLMRIQRSANQCEILSPHISECCADLIHKLGGLGPFTQFWAEHILALRDKPFQAVKACEAVSKLIKMSTEHRQTAPDVTALNDADLAAEIAKHLRSMDVKGESLCGEN